MSKIILPYFSEIDLDNLEDYYETEVAIGNEQISIDLNLDDEPLSDWQEGYTQYANNLGQHLQNIRSAFDKYYDEEGMVKEFYTYHQEELGEEIDELLKEADQNLTEKERMLSILKLERIGFYFDEDNFATWDFMFGDFSDQILVVITDAKGEILDITWES